jgi:hypothetical protein
MNARYRALTIDFLLRWVISVAVFAGLGYAFRPEQFSLWLELGAATGFAVGTWLISHKNFVKHRVLGEDRYRVVRKVAGTFLLWYCCYVFVALVVSPRLSLFEPEYSAGAKMLFGLLFAAITTALSYPRIVREAREESEKPDKPAETREPIASA